MSPPGSVTVGGCRSASSARSRCGRATGSSRWPVPGCAGCSPGSRSTPAGRCRRRSWSRRCGPTTRRPTSPTRCSPWSPGCAGAWATPALIQQVPTGYRLAVEAADVDAVAFTTLARHRQRAAARRRCRSAPRPRSSRRSRCGAASRWSTPTTPPYTVALLARWDQERLAALGDRIDADLQLGAGAEVIGELEELVAAHPLHEQFVGRLMAALAAAGRTADALTAYQSLRARLADELGTDPGPDIQAQHLQLLRGSEPDPYPAPVRHTNLRGRGVQLRRPGDRAGPGRAAAGRRPADHHRRAGRRGQDPAGRAGRDAVGGPRCATASGWSNSPRSPRRRPSRGPCCRPGHARPTASSTAGRSCGRG